MGFVRLDPSFLSQEFGAALELPKGRSLDKNTFLVFEMVVSHQLTWVCAQTPVARRLPSWLVGLFTLTHVGWWEGSIWVVCFGFLSPSLAPGNKSQGPFIEAPGSSRCLLWPIYIYIYIKSPSHLRNASSLRVDSSISLGSLF